MGPFDFLKGLGTLKSNIEQYFSPATSQVSNTLTQYFPSRSNNFRLDKSPAAPQLSIPQQQQQPAPQAAPPAQPPRPTAQDYTQGFNAFGANVPVATQGAQFAQAGAALPSNIDPYLPAIISLMESGGGAKTVAPNNAWNIRGMQNGQQQFVSYPDLATALLGGDNNGVQSSGFVGQVLNNPAYAPFRSSGNIQDFFQTYTPPGAAYGNPSMDELVARYQALHALFPQLQ